MICRTRSGGSSSPWNRAKMESSTLHLVDCQTGSMITGTLQAGGQRSEPRGWVKSLENPIIIITLVYKRFMWRIQA
jgi:hypothetical protein